MKSCTLLAVQCDGAQIMTIEGLAKDGKLHPIQEGFWEKHGLQCGFCTPGMIMSAAPDARSGTRKPTEAQIRHQLEGNLCRCTGYHNIVKAIQYAAEKMAQGEGGATMATARAARREHQAAGGPPVHHRQGELHRRPEAARA